MQTLGEHGEALALDSWREAVAQRVDHPSSHRGLAYALLQAGEHEEAFAVIAAALDRHYPSRYEKIERILLDDAELVVAAWLAAAPEKGRKIRSAAAKARASGAGHLLLSNMRGHLCDMDRLMRVAKECGLTVIEDCAHTMGARWNGTRSGNFGNIGCFSTQTYKHMNSGEGGLLTLSLIHI